MKRTPLRRTRIKPISKQRAKLLASKANKNRKLWSAQWQWCWACGAENNSSFIPNQCHEIVPKGETSDWCHLQNFAWLCQACHQETHGGWLKRGQVLYLKLVHDRENYDLKWIIKHSLKKHWKPSPPRRRWWEIG